MMKTAMLRLQQDKSMWMDSYVEYLTACDFTLSYLSVASL